MNSDWFKGSLLLAATLSAGIAIGIWHGRSYSPGAAPDGESVGMRIGHEHVMQLLGQALKLDSTQRLAILATLHRHQAHIDSAWGTLRPHVSATMDSTHAEIMNLLRPEQRAAFEQMMTHGHGGSHRH